MNCSVKEILIHTYCGSSPSTLITGFSLVEALIAENINIFFGGKYEVLRIELG